MAKWDPTSAFLYKVFLGTPLKLWASVGHWLVWHFDLNKYTEKQKPRVSECAPMLTISEIINVNLLRRVGAGVSTEVYSSRLSKRLQKSTAILPLL